MRHTLPGKVLVAQGGGPTAVVNQSLAGIVLEARKFSQIDGVYGALNGVEGILAERFVNLSRETTQNLEMVATTPGSALLSTRMKPKPEDCLRMFDILRKHDIRYFFYIGGNDSSETLQIINQAAKKADYELRCLHVPKTIDNDLVENDHTPGFGSAARFVAEAFMGLNLDNRALGGVTIGVVMGRHAGFLTGASCLARKYEDDGPHLIYVPERPLDTARFLEDVKKVHDRLGRCLIAVSEGITNKKREPIITTIIENVESCEFGNLQMSGTGALGDALMEYIKEGLNISRVRSDTFGYIQRSFLSCVSDRDAREAREAAEKAVQFAMWDDVDGSIAIKRPVLNYSADYQLVPLEKVAGKTRLMPDEFINAEGNGVTQAFHDYVRPLVGSGLAEAHRLRAPVVKPIE